MKIFLDYLFYKIYWWNTKIIKQKDSPFFYSIMGLSAFYIVNYTTIIFFALLLINGNILIYPKWIQIVVMSIIVCYCYYYYMHKRDRYRIIQYFEGLNAIKIKRLNLSLVIFIILTVVCHIGIVIYIKELN